MPEQQCRAAASMGWASVLKIQPPDSTTHSPKGVLMISPENQWKQDFKKYLIPIVTGQLNSEWIYEVIVSPKIPTKNYQDFCPTL